MLRTNAPRVAWCTHGFCLAQPPALQYPAQYAVFSCNQVYKHKTIVDSEPRPAARGLHEYLFLRDGNIGPVCGVAVSSRGYLLDVWIILVPR